MKLVENPKMPYPHCGRSIKTYSQTTMMPPKYHKVWVCSTATRANSCTVLALLAHCAKCTPSSRTTEALRAKALASFGE